MQHANWALLTKAVFWYLPLGAEMVPTITDNGIGPRCLTRCADSVASDMQHVAETSGRFGSRRKIVFCETHRDGS